MKAKASPAAKAKAGSASSAPAKASTTKASAATKTKNAQKAASKHADEETAPSVNNPVDFSAADQQEETEAEAEEAINYMLAHPEDQQPSIDLTMDVIVYAHVLDSQTGSQPASEAYLRNLTHLHLDRLCIATLYTDVLGALPAVTHLYLQHNRLSSLQPLACMPQLQFLAASHNQLETVCGLEGLDRLLFVDVSYNCITDLEPSALPSSVKFLKLEGNPFVKGQGTELARLRVLEHLPGLHHFDGDLDSDGELIESSEEEEGQEAVPGACSASSAAASSTAAALRSSSSLQAAMMPRMIALLEDLERRCYAGTQGPSSAMLRTSYARSDTLRASLGALPPLASLQGPMPGTASHTTCPASVEGFSAATMRPASSAGTNALSTTAAAAGGRLGIPGRPSSSSSPAPAATAGTSSLPMPAAGSGLALLRCRSRPGSVEGVREAFVNLGPSASGVAASAALSQSPQQQAASSHGVIPATNASSRPGSANFLGECPLPAIGSNSAVGPAAGQGVSSRDCCGLGNAEDSGSDDSEDAARMADDFSMLSARVIAILEPCATGTHGQDAAIFDARAQIHSHVDRMMGQGASRLREVREAQSGVVDNIKALRASLSQLTALRARGKESLVAVVKSKGNAASGAEPRSPSSSSFTHAVPQSAEVMTLDAAGNASMPAPAHRVANAGLRASLARLEGMLQQVDALAAETTQVLSSNLATAVSGRPGSSSAGSGRPGSSMAAAGKRPGTATKSVSVPSMGGDYVKETRVRGLASAAAGADGDNDSGGSGLHVGVSGEEDIAMSWSRELLCVPEDDGEEGLYSDDDEPRMDASSSDLAFMFNTSLPPNPFSKGL